MRTVVRKAHNGDEVTVTVPENMSGAGALEYYVSYAMEFYNECHPVLHYSENVDLAVRGEEIS